MKADLIYNQILKTAKYLLKELDYYGENQFKQRITDNHWTIGELYDYLINGTISFYIPQIQNCLDPAKSRKKGKKRLKGKFVFWYGRIPAIMKYKDPTNYTPVQPESPESMKDSVYKFIKQMNKAAQEIDSSTVNNKTLHLSFGMLNALEWYTLIDIHVKHFLKDKEEIDRVLRGASYEE